MAQVLVRRLAFALLVVSVSLLPLGCGTGNGGGFNPLAGNHNEPTIGTLEGYLFAPTAASRQATGLRLGLNAAPPAGFQPAAEAQVSVVGGDGTTTTNAQGFWRLSNLTAGPTRVQFQHGEASLEATATVIDDRVAVVGDAPFSRAEAVTAVRADLATMDLNEDRLLLIGPSHPLPAETLVFPALGDARGEYPAAVTRISQRPEWFFYVDPHASSRQAHGVLYYHLDAVTGTLERRSEHSWPSFNRVEHYRDVEASLASPDLVLAPTVEPPIYELPETSRQQSINDRTVADAYFAARPVVSACGTGKVYGLVVAGYDEDIITIGADQMETLLTGTLAVPAAQVKRHSGPTADPVRDVQTALTQLFAVMQPCDTLVLYIDSHGVEDSRVNDVSLQSSAPLIPRFPAGTTLSNGLVNIKKPAIRDVAWGLDRCPACHIVVIIEVCWAGRAIARTPGFKSILDAMAGREALLLTATDATHAAESFSDGFLARLSTVVSIKGPGGTYARNLLAEAKRLADNSLGGVAANQQRDMVRLFYEASKFFDANTLTQNPQWYLRGRQPGEVCPGAPATPPPAGPPPSQPPANQPPVANAGPDRTVQQTSFTLDGSGSSDPDGQIVRHTWREGATVVGQAAQVTVERPIGTYTFTLEVEDNAGATATDQVTITVVAPQPVRCAGVRVSNSGTGALRFRVVSTSHQFNGGALVTLATGEEFFEVSPVEITGLNLTDFQSAPFEAEPFNQGFNIRVPCGRLQVFNFSNSGLSFDQVALPPP